MRGEVEKRGEERGGEVGMISVTDFRTGTVHIQRFRS